VWRLGDGTVALFGTQWTKKQVQLLTQKVKKAYIMFDSDAIKKAYKLAGQLSGLISTEIIELKKGDPADLDNITIRELRREIFKEEE